MLPAEVESSVEDINLTLHVRLSRLIAQILTSKYINLSYGVRSATLVIDTTQSHL